jgi:BON domain-containing protein/YmgG-like glycine-zipper protein
MKKSLNPWLASSMLVLVLSGLGACSKSVETPTTPTDASITEALKASLSSDSQLSGQQVDLTVSNGEVTLSGDVSTDAAHLQAYKLANETPGVKKVNDLLQVRPAAASAAPQEPTRVASSKSPAPSRPAPSVRPASPSAQSAAPSSVPSAAPAAQQTGSSSVAPSAPPPPPPPRVVSIPAGTSIQVQMIDSVDSATNKIGDTFLASLAAPIVVNNEVIIPKNADVQVKLASAKTSGKFTGQSELTLALDSVKFRGNSYPLTSSTFQQMGESRGKDTAKKTAIGAAIGTAIGAIAGGGKGAAIGAGIGAGSGAATQVFMKGKQVKVPSETKIDFQLEQPVDVTLSGSKK